jgi:peptide/nickel transport system ATP-binding protein
MGSPHPSGRRASEPLRLHLSLHLSPSLSATAGRAQALRLLECVQRPQAAQRRQAVTASSRALITGPHLIAAERPDGDRDVSVRAPVLNLVQDLHERHGITQRLLAAVPGRGPCGA